MDKEDKQQWRCRECGCISLGIDLLRAQNPFGILDTVVGCPECKDVCDFDEICDDGGCDKRATCGFPTAEGDEFGGYIRTCYEHSKYSGS